MYNSLYGTVSGARDGVVYLNSESGIEWELQASAQTIAFCLERRGANDRARLFTYLHHRQDILRLYGFATSEERALFLQLIKVNGIGPSQAQKIISNRPHAEITRIIERGDEVAMSAIPGLGVKTARKIILALRGNLASEPQFSPSSGDDIVDALVAMGYDQQKCRQTVAELRDAIGGQYSDQSELEGNLLRKAIERLSGSYR